jgi:hypothetical protein
MPPTSCQSKSGRFSVICEWQMLNRQIQSREVVSAATHKAQQQDIEGES